MAWRVSIERWAAILMGIPCVICCFFLAAFIFSLCVWCCFIWLICVLGCFALGLNSLGSLVFSDLGGYFLPMGFLTTIYSSIFLCPFFLASSSSGTPIILMLGHFTLSQGSEVVLISFNSILIFSSLLHLFMSFYLPPHVSSLLPRLFYCWFPPECFWSQLLNYSLLIDSCLFLLDPG